MDDRQQYDRTSQRDQECHGCERGVVDVASGEDQAADERTDNADHDIEDDALLTICPHDDAGKPSDNAANDEPHDNSHNHSPVIQKTIWPRSEEHTSELQSLMRISYAVFCLKKKNKKHNKH